MNLRDGFVLGDWAVLPMEGRIASDTGSTAVRPKAVDVLLCLAEAGGAVVERDDLLRKVWGERAVSDEPLTRCISDLRRALGDPRSEPEYILTIPKRGYRLLKVPQPLPKGKTVTTAVSSGPGSWSRRIFDAVRKPTVALGLIVTAVVAVIVIENVADRLTPKGPEDATSTVADHSIAVLPFTDMSPGQDQAYMGDGVAEEVLSLLARIPGLRVISRSSTFSLKGSTIDIRNLARQFNVGYVLEGSVRTSADRVRVTVQLIDGRTDTHVWAETYDRKLHDIFEIQDDIASAVVSRLKLTILGDAPKSRPTDPETYALFLQGRYLHERPAGDSMQRAFDYYKAALAIDPDYVPAWVWLGALYDDTVNSAGLPREEAGRLAQAAVERALEIDANDPLALGMRAVLISDWNDDLAGAAAYMQKAIDRDPTNPILLRWSAIVLTRLGRHDEAVSVNEYLYERDPLGNIAKINLAATYLNAGRYVDAIRVCRIEVALTDESSPCGSRLILAYVHAGDSARALEQLERTNPSRVYMRLAPLVFASLGRHTEFEQSLRELLSAYEMGDTGLSYWVAYTWAFAGDADQAFEWLERARQHGVLGVAPHEHAFRDIAKDARWASLMERAGMSADTLDAIALRVPVLEQADSPLIKHLR